LAVAILNSRRNHPCCAARQRLDLKKQRVKYGRQLAPPGSRATETTLMSPREALMGKTESRIRVKRRARKGNAKTGLNGSSSVRATIGGKKPPPRAQAKTPPKPTRKSRHRGGNIVLPEGYRPSENEPFMNERQKIYFRNKLVAWKEEIVRQNRETLQILHEDSAQHADLADRATSETDRALELRARDRQRKLINKIDAALARIEEGSYGFCEETGEPIGLKRLDARPIATLSLEAQERHERREKVFRED
jgi:DnaK suppressor protein